MAFGDTIQIGDLVRALSRARATATAHVGSGATTTTIPLADLNLAGENLAGNLVLLDAGALGAGSPPTFATIQSNTATSLTVSALSTAPQQGAELWIFVVATMQANLSENIAQWSGTTVAAPQGDNADGVAATSSGLPLMLARLTAWTGSAWSRLRLAVSGSLQVRDDATGATGAAVPGAGTLIAGTDGTYLRALGVDGNNVGKTQLSYAEQTPGSAGPSHAVQIGGLDPNGNTIVPRYLPNGAPQPQVPSIAVWLSSFSASANTNLLTTPYQPPANGTLTIRVLVSAATTVSVVETPSVTPSTGGTTAAVTGTLNDGASLTAGAWYEFSFSVLQQATYNFQVGAAATLTLVATFKID